METMTFGDFKVLCFKKQNTAKGIIVPVYKKILADLLTPVNAYLKIKEQSNYSFLLESVEGGERIARYSFLGYHPSEIVSLTDGKVTHTSGEESATYKGNGLDQLRDILSKYEPVDIMGLPPLTCGAIGYISYNSVRYFFNLNGNSSSTLSSQDQPPDMQFAFYRTIMAFDHFKHQAILISNVFINDDELKSLNDSVTCLPPCVLCARWRLHCPTGQSPHTDA